MSFYGRRGEPMELMEWAQVCVTDRHVARDEFDGGTVSTVWLGIDEAFPGSPPLIFETMILAGPLEGEMWRYSTEEEALAGHAEAVRLAREAVADS